MSYQYTIIENVKKPGLYSETRFSTHTSEHEILQYLGVAAAFGPDSEVSHIVRMDEHGHTVEMDAVFEKGRFQLKALPAAYEGR